MAWDGGAGTTNWHDPLNWDTDALPTESDDVTIDVPGDVVIEFTGQAGDQTVNSIQSNEFVRLGGGSLTVNAASSFAAGIGLSFSRLSGAGDVT